MGRPSALLKVQYSRGEGLREGDSYHLAVEALLFGGFPALTVRLRPVGVPFRDPAMRWIFGGRAVGKEAASTSPMGRFETETLTSEANLTVL